MNRFLALFLLVASGILAGRHTGAVWAQDQPNAWQPRRAVVMLRNGSVLSGDVLRSGDYYEIQFPDGELRLRNEEVAFVGDNLEACYQYRRQGVEYQKVDDHLSLAEWCLRHNLLAAAGRELRDAMACDPKHPKIALLERHLKLAMETPAKLAASEPARVGLARPEDLDRMIRSMPAGTVETFTNVIQPLLLNQCSTSHCHGPTSSTKLKLLRVAAGKTQSRRATQRNLHAVLSCIDTENPDASKLLAMPIRPHGTSVAAVFTSKQAFQYRQLVNWVHAVAHRPQVVEPTLAEKSSTVGWPEETGSAASSSATVEASNKGRNSSSKRASDGQVRTASATSAEPKPADNSDASPTDELTGVVERAVFTEESDAQFRRVYRPGERPARSQVKHGAAQREAKTEDPFDPEEFNRQYSERD